MSHNTMSESDEGSSTSSDSSFVLERLAAKSCTPNRLFSTDGYIKRTATSADKSSSPPAAAEAYGLSGRTWLLLAFGLPSLIFAALAAIGAVVWYALGQHEHRVLFRNHRQLYTDISALCRYRLPLKFPAANLSDNLTLWWSTSRCLVQTYLQIHDQQQQQQQHQSRSHPSVHQQRQPEPRAGHTADSSYPCQDRATWERISRQVALPPIGEAIYQQCVNETKEFGGGGGDVGGRRRQTPTKCPKFLSEEEKVCDMCRLASGQRAGALARRLRPIVWDNDVRLRVRARYVEGDIVYSDELLFAAIALKERLSNDQSTKLLRVLFFGTAIAEFLIATNGSKSSSSWIQREVAACRLHGIGLQRPDASSSATASDRDFYWTELRLYWALRVENYCAFRWSYDKRIVDDSAYRKKLEDIMTHSEIVSLST